jgi:hypothetical protein
MNKIFWFNLYNYYHTRKNVQELFRIIGYYHSHRELWLSMKHILLGNIWGMQSIVQFPSKGSRNMRVLQLTRIFIQKRFHQSFREHASAAIGGSNTTYGRLRPCTRLRSQISPWFPRLLSRYVCDYYGIVEWANWLDPSVAFDKQKVRLDSRFIDLKWC